MLVWGALSAVMAVSHTYGALLGFRFILGYARLLEFLLLSFIDIDVDTGGD